MNPSSWLLHMAGVDQPRELPVRGLDLRCNDNCPQAERVDVK